VILHIADIPFSVSELTAGDELVLRRMRPPGFTAVPMAVCGYAWFEAPTLEGLVSVIEARLGRGVCER
jgi:hypothetical protein